MTTDKRTHGIARIGIDGVEWFPIGYHYPRLHKGHVCFTTPCPALSDIAKRLGDEWQVRQPTKAERQFLNVADVGDPAYGEPVSVLDEPRQKSLDADLTDESGLIQS